MPRHPQKPIAEKTKMHEQVELPALRDYQLEAVRKVMWQLASGKRRVMLSSATGSGKSLLMMHMALAAHRQGKRVVVICDRIQLVQQMSRQLNAAGMYHGIIQADNSRATYLPVLVASIQTLAARGMQHGAEADLLLIDEAHGCAGREEYRKVIEAAMKTTGAAVVGFSATPWSKGLAKPYDALGGPLFESMVTTVPIPKLIELGFLVDCDVYAPCDPDLSKVKITAGDYNEKQLGEAMNKTPLIADIVQTWLKYAAGKPTVCFATNIAHSEALMAEFVLNGIPAEHISCKTKDVERIEILKRVESGKTKVICNAMLLTTGWDFPACEVMILARPTKSLVTYVQMVGRVLRPSPGKSIATLLDHSGTSMRLGFPTDDRSDIPMCDGKPKVGVAEKKEKPEALPKPCPNCAFLKPEKTHKCPKCGFESKKQSDVEVIDGELKLIKCKKIEHKHDVPWKEAPKWKPTPLHERFGSKQQVYSELLYYCSEKGFKQGWAAMKYKDIFGKWPNNLANETKQTSMNLRNWIREENLKWKKSQEIKSA